MAGDRSVKVLLKGDISDYNRAMLEAEGVNKSFGRSLDSSNDKMSNLVQSSLALGPALVPISAAAIPALTGLSNQLGIGVAAIGVGTLAFKGLGKALDAVNAASIDPTAANLQKMNLELSQLGPAGQDFVLFLQRARPKIQELQELSRAGLFPGVEDGLHSLSGLLPDVEHIITTISTTLGDLAAEGGTNLDSPKWHEFIAFLDSEARPTLLATGRTIGNFTEGLANLWMAFSPLSNDFSRDLLSLSRDFAHWTDGLDKTQDFQEFLAYVERTGPEVWHTLGAVGNALLQIVEAAAPVGSAVLPVIEDVSDAIATLADSDLGPVIIGVVSLTSALSRLKALGIAANSSAIGGLLGKTAYGGTLTQVKALPGALLAVESAEERARTKAGALSETSTRLSTSLKGTAKAAGLGGGLAFAMSGLDEKMGLTHTTTLALAGSFAGPWGAAVGAAVGLAIDLTHQTDGAAESVKKFQAAFAGSSSIADQAAIIGEYRKQIAALQDIRDNSTGLVRDSASDSLKTLKDGLGPLVKQHEAAVQAAHDQAFAEAGLAGQMNGASKATRDETYALLENIKAKNEAADAAENAFSAETNYRQALKDAEKQARSNNAGINGNSDAALKNRGALDQLATAWNRVADAGNASRGDMKKAKADFISVAEGMGVSKKAAEDLAAELFHIPSPKVTVSVKDKASGVIDTIIRQMRNLDGTVATTTIRTNRVTGVSTSSGGGRTATNQATGGYIRGPGTATSDSIPAYLSNGEYVVRAAAVAKYGTHMFDHLNAQTFAAGGSVGPASSNLDWARHASDANLKWAITTWQKALDKNTEKLSTLKDTMKSFSDTVRDSFRTDPFNQTTSTGQTGLAAFDLSLATDTANATAMGKALDTLTAKHVSAGLYAAVAQSHDLTTAQQLAALSVKGLDQQDALYLGRNRATSALGLKAGDTEYGKQIAAQTAEIHRMRQDIHEFKTELKSGVKEGMKDISRDFVTAARKGK